MRSLKGKTVLVTGGAGFIGSHLTEGIIKAGGGHHQSRCKKSDCGGQLICWKAAKPR